LGILFSSIDTLYIASSEAFTEMTIQVEVVWFLTPRIFAIGYQRFRDPCCLHLRGEVERWYPVTTLHGVTGQKISNCLAILYFSSITPEFRTVATLVTVNV